MLTCNKVSVIRRSYYSELFWSKLQNFTPKLRQYGYTANKILFEDVGKGKVLLFLDKPNHMTQKYSRKQR